MKRVVVIGSGNVAEILAEAIADGSGYALVQIYARNRERGEYIAGKVGCRWTDDPQSLAEADIYLIAVSDTAVGPIARMLDFGGAVVAHTAGSVSIDELSGCSEHTGVFYPLQSFTAGRSLDLHGVPFFIEVSSDRALEALRDLGNALSGRVIEIPFRRAETTSPRCRFRFEFCEPHVCARRELAGGVRALGRVDQTADAGDSRQGFTCLIRRYGADRSCAAQRPCNPEKTPRTVTGSAPDATIV